MERDNLCISWKSLPWGLFERKIFQLQCKIYKAKQSGNFILVKRLQKLLIHSKSTHFIATRLLTDSGDNRKFSECEKYTLASNIHWSLRGGLCLNKFRFSKSNKNLEFKKILVIQYILRLALEPLYYEKVYWILWKRGQSVVRLIKKLSCQVKRASRHGWKKVLRFEVNFPQVGLNFNSFISHISLPFKYKLFIYNILTVTCFDKHTTENSLANFLRSILVNRIVRMNYFGKDLLSRESNSGIFSYTHSNIVVCFIKQRNNFYQYIDELKNYLLSYGLSLDLSSVYISRIDEGFDFFGWFFKKQMCKKIHISFSRNSWILYKKLFKSVLGRKYSSDFKIKKMILLNLNLFRRYSYIPRSKLKNKFYFLKRSIFRYSKTLTSLKKKVLFQSLRLKLF
jgi:hypothetical protein